MTYFGWEELFCDVEDLLEVRLLLAELRPEFKNINDKLLHQLSQLLDPVLLIPEFAVLGVLILDQV